MSRRTAALIVTCVGVLTPFGAMAQRAWVEVKSPHFTVATEAGERAGRDVAWQFEQVRSALKVVWPDAQVDLDRPVAVLAVRNEDAMRQLAPQYWEAKDGIRPATVFVTGPDRHWVALRTDVIVNDRLARANPYQMAYWSFAGLVIRATFGQNLPPWLFNGLAGVMSNTIVTIEGIQVGRIPPDAWERVRSGGRFRLPEFLAMTADAPELKDPNRRWLFDAQAAVFTHYLMFGEGGAHEPALNKFVALLGSGRLPLQAWSEAFPNSTAVDDGFRLYLQNSAYSYHRIAVDAAVRRDDFQLRPLGAADAAVRQAGFHAAMRRPTEARALVAEARKTSPGVAGAFEVEGLLLEADGKPDDARAAFGQAADAGSMNFYALYRWAAMTWRPQGLDAPAAERVEAVAEKSVRTHPTFAPALVLLGQIRQARGAHDDAVAFVRRAVSLAPDRSGYRGLLAQVLWNAGKRDEARIEAERAVAAATSPAERQSAERMLEFMSRAAAPRSAGPDA